MSFRFISETPNFDFFKPMKFWLAVSILGVVLTVVVLVEKLFPAGDWISRIAGLLLVAWGVYLVIAA